MVPDIRVSAALNASTYAFWQLATNSMRRMRIGGQLDALAE